jgi:hypothetical protein
MKLTGFESIDQKLVTDVRSLIASARQRTISAVNAELTLLYWGIGSRINVDVLAGERASYGKQILAGLAETLTFEFGKGWTEQNLRHCMQLASIFPDREILYSLSRELSWTHLRNLIYVAEPLKREFYIEIAKLERWSVRQLQERIKSMLFERTAISRKPE